MKGKIFIVVQAKKLLMIEKNSNLYFLGIVGIVAVVGIVILIIGLKSPSVEIQSSSLEEMQTCESDEDCIYADNTCCPFTQLENVMTINREFKEEYKLMGEKCLGEMSCFDILLGFDNDALKCINNMCTTSDPKLKNS